jgi:hypothetical protein
MSSSSNITASGPPSRTEAEAASSASSSVAPPPPPPPPPAAAESDDVVGAQEVDVSVFPTTISSSPLSPSSSPLPNFLWDTTKLHLSDADCRFSSAIAATDHATRVAALEAQIKALTSERTGLRVALDGLQARYDEREATLIAEIVQHIDAREELEEARLDLRVEIRNLAARLAAYEGVCGTIE